MRKKIIFGAIIVLTIILVIFVFGLETKRNSQNNLVAPTPIIIRPPENKIKIISTDPRDQTKNVSLNKKITISFNDFVGLKAIDISIIPSAKYSTQMVGTNLILSTSGLTPNTLYSVYITPKNELPSSFSFSTIQDPNASGQDVAAATAAENVKRLHPDAYLSAFVPYSDGSFSIVSTYVDQPPHYTFTVHAVGIPARNNLILWLRSLGLTDAQISTLDITFQ